MGGMALKVSIDVAVARAERTHRLHTGVLPDLPSLERFGIRGFHHEPHMNGQVLDRWDRSRIQADDGLAVVGDLIERRESRLVGNAFPCGTAPEARQKALAMRERT
jgi:hypothetical protein